MDDRDVVERQIGRRPRAFRAVAARCPFGAPAVTEQSPYDGAGAPFPTTYYLTCRHLVAAVSRLEAAGGVERWSAAVAASPELAADLAAATAAAAQSGARSPPAGRGADHGASLDSGHRRLAQPRRSSSASMPTSPSRSPIRATASGSSSSPSSPSRGPAIAAASEAEHDVRERRPSTAPGATGRTGIAASSSPHATRRQAERLRRQFDLISAELRRRVGGTFTLAMLARRVRGLGRLGAAGVEEHAPTPGWARSVSMVGDAAFHVYARGAVDYTP